ncbi:MAG: SpoIIE family protein phosphatase [Alphaproteobacteria bacterium]|jgi:hypothetical protein|nr:SpoIIE family protein phosphatase [Alphaproteobacteria bacterium]
MRTLACMIDGLGHGEEAEVAALAALAYVEANVEQSMPDLFSGCDAALKATRGAAVGICLIDRSTATLDYAAVGNTRFALVGTTLEYLSGGNGIVGAGVNPMISEQRKIEHGMKAVMWTDGISELIDFAPYRQLLEHDASEAANAILRDNATPQDDACVLVWR